MAVNRQQRQAFADLLEEIASGQLDRRKWSALVVTHYLDDKLEEIRREVVRQDIAERFDPLKLKAWSIELRG